jgi:ABC-type multidrug transport system ATPase subunit
MERTCDHVTMIQNGQITFDTDLDTIKETHRFSRVTFAAHQAQPPILAGALLTQGGGHSWHMVHDVPIEQFRMAVHSAGGEVTESRMASLEEIFLARAGRSVRHDKAA